MTPADMPRTINPENNTITDQITALSERLRAVEARLDTLRTLVHTNDASTTAGFEAIIKHLESEDE